jgi:DNA helicase II / ATP-dependent DNA helicase PcrA
MNDRFHCTLPEITDAEIRRASRLLGLQESAFYGEDNLDPRQEVLKSVQQMDIAACPGSGKTTLLVAKLAILAEKWSYRTCGICVLSHTNAARNEIESKLGNTSSGRVLLSYPHFVGTIHRFVNEFLAIPWLRSHGYPIKMIDTDVSERRRWNKLTPNSRVFLQNKSVDESNIRILDANYSLAKKNGQFPCGANTDTYINVKQACQETAREGYHCYDDMFVWARELTNAFPWLIGTIRNRFPFLFIDEAQDNGEDQSAILYRIFMDGGNGIVRQRFGDANQAIYNFVGDSGAVTDVFPEQAVKKDLPNSHRFGATIATLADPLSLDPCGLTGCGPTRKQLASGATEGRHTIFLFDEANVTKVLDTYGQLLLETFSDEELSEKTFTATAVGQVHKDKGDDHNPRHIGRYWPEYDPELVSRDPKPQTFVKYVLAGIAKTERVREVFVATEMIAEGILRLVRMSDGGIILRQRKHCHRYVLQLLEGCVEARRRYGEVLDRYAVRRESPTKETWDDRRRGIVRMIAESAGKGSLANPDAEAFLAWPLEPDIPVLSGVVPMVRDNVYRYHRNGRKVAIQVGSIHSVKGKTHTATLVLETFWQDSKGRHNLQLLSPWLGGDKSGGLSVGVQQQSRLKLHYVAMTRPTHLLCLAMKRSTFSKADGGLDEDVVQKLKVHGWCEIKCV